MPSARIDPDRAADRPDGPSEDTRDAQTAHPPCVPLVCRVGVTGHRPDRAKRPDTDVALPHDEQDKDRGTILWYPKAAALVGFKIVARGPAGTVAAGV